MNIRQALHQASQSLTQSPSPTLDARLLLQHLLGVNHAHLIAHDTDPLPPHIEQQYQHLLSQAQQQIPIPYLIGHAPFYGRDFHVSPAVLIPRPETEELITLTARWLKQYPHLHQPHIVDVGTGSGCIPVTLAAEFPHLHLTAIDISPDALALAQRNAARHQCTHRITFHHGDLLTPLTQPADLIIANLPYVTDQEWTQLDDGVKLYEPALALKGGHDGLDLIRRLLTQAPKHLTSHGSIFLEIGWQQGQNALKLAQTHFPPPYQTQLLTDFATNDRFITITPATPS
ncbi:MAG TPA: peptide chain release factor N(5)-glutamine methyltransferase [Anaerolineae bacterium]|nr:peptide chain release factor N(5)-glutamine methyltransferase [Anaerolineae bacterium]